MTRSDASAGYFRSGLPYNRFGRGPRIAVVGQDLQFEHKPLTRPLAAGMGRMYRFLVSAYTIYLVSRRPGLPVGYTLRDMADDYAAMIREEFGGPVDVIGRSTGGAIAQHLAADHPELVRRLVLHATAYRPGEAARRAQWRSAQPARRRSSSRATRTRVIRRRWRARRPRAFRMSGSFSTRQWAMRPSARRSSEMC